MLSKYSYDSYLASIGLLFGFLLVISDIRCVFPIASEWREAASARGVGMVTNVLRFSEEDIKVDR